MTRAGGPPLATALVVLAAAACIHAEQASEIPPPARPVLHTGSRPVMGTVLTISLAADGAQELLGQAFAIARRYDDVLTTWRPEGELARLNARAGAGFVEVGPELHQALRAMLDLSAQTGGAFDPAVGPIVRALRENRSAPALSDTTYRIASAVRLTRGRAALARGAELDAGAIGKGIAVDAIVRHLRRAGVASAYVDFGASSIAALGVRPDGSPWRVALVGPQGIVGTTVLADEALSTSRSAEPNDPAGAIVDPETLRPVPPGRVATVVAPSATVAEAWSTALVVRGRPALQSAAAHGLKALFADSSGIALTEGEWFEPVGLPAPASLHPHVELPNREPWERRAERDLARIHP